MVVDLLDDRDHLPNAIAMNSLQFNLSRALGPLLAVVTLAAWGSFWCFFFNAISFLPLIFVLGRIKKRQQPVAATGVALGLPTPQRCRVHRPRPGSPVRGRRSAPLRNACSD